MAAEDQKPTASEEVPPDKDPVPEVEPASEIKNALAQVRVTLQGYLQTEHLPDYMEHPEMAGIIKLQKFAYAIVNAAKKAQIPPELIDHYLYDFCVRQIALKNFKMVADLLRNLKLATPEIQHYFDQLAAQQAIRKKQKDAMAEQQNKRRNRIPLRLDATLADLNRALSAKDVVSDMYELFMKALYESPHKERGEALLDIWDTPQAEIIRIVDFFDCDPEDVQEELPIDWIDGNA